MKKIKLVKLIKRLCTLLFYLHNLIYKCHYIMLKNVMNACSLKFNAFLNYEYYRRVIAFINGRSYSFSQH